MFNTKFPKIRPIWLMSSKNNPLELDGYNEELNIAFEHNGKQHYEDIGIFGCSKHLRINDKLKVKQCKEKGINLIIIPYTCNKNDIQQFIIKECEKLKINIPNKTNINLLNMNIKRSSNIEELKNIAKKKGGELISNTYLGSTYKLKFKCKRNHTWFATPSKIKFGRWCPKCRYIKDHYQFYKDLIESKGGTIISTKYVNFNTKLEYYCDKNHKTATTPTILKGGSWCKTCSIDNIKKNGTGDKIKVFNEIKEIVEKRGGRMISKKYGLSGVKLEFYCENNHHTSGRPNDFKRGVWCTICNKLHLNNKDGKLKKFNEVKDIIEKKGGIMISIEYVGAFTPLKFYCENGHISSSKRRNQILQNKWCNTCSKEKLNNKQYLICKQKIEDIEGIIISKKYIVNEKIDFYCKKKHKNIYDDR